MLEIKNLNFRRENFQLKDISFTLQEGYIMGLIGENGAGKTTLIELIMNLIPPDSGEIIIFDLPNSHENNIPIKNNIGFVYDTFPAYTDMTLDQLARFMSAFYPNWNQKDCSSLIKKLKINSMQKIKDLSKGNQMKAQIILALSHQARLIIMDEPSSGLDPVIRKEVMTLLQEYVQKYHASVLFSTHITSDLEHIADYITFLHQGKLLFSMDLEQLQEEYKIVKIPLECMKKDYETQFIGWEKNDYFVTALVKQNFPFHPEMVWETASLQDIMYYYCR